MTDSLPATVEFSSGKKSPGTRRWLDVVILWVAAVSAQALILFLLMEFQMQQWQSIRFESVANSLSTGRVKEAAARMAISDTIAYPTDALVKFALVGLAVVALAWVGRRTLAWALPFLMIAASMSPLFAVDSLPRVPMPIGELNDWQLWPSLARDLTGGPLGSEWPLLLGAAVQTVLLLLPLVAAPHPRAAVSLMSAARTAALPTLAVTVFALGTLQYSDLTELYGMPVVVATIGFLSAAIATGTGSAWVRLPAAVGVPAALGASIMPIDVAGSVSGVETGLSAAVAALFIVLGVLVTPWLHTRIDALRHQSDPGCAAVA